MDNLARNAMLARQANMSYGKWKAMHYVPPKPVDPVAVVIEAKKEERRCLMCGVVIRKKNKKYCNEYCGQQYRYRRKIGLIKEGDDHGKT